MLVVVLLSGFPATGQVKISKVLSPSTISPYQSSHLVLIDFWATWCVPCINSGKQLEITQEIYRDDLTIISLSNEREAIVQKFIDVHHPKLTMALDDENQTFNFFQVNKTLPYAVLLNQRGRILWQGHPADLSRPELEKFIRQNKKYSRKPDPNFIAIAAQAARPQVAETPRLVVERSLSEDTYCSISEEGIEFQGRASKLFSEIQKKSLHDIRIENDPIIHVHLVFPGWRMRADSIMCLIQNRLMLTVEVLNEETRYYRLAVKNPKLLWDKTRISLGDANGALLIGEDSITLDNASVADFCFRLSDVMEYPVYTDYASAELYDWLVHYKYYHLTREQLENEYGLHIELKEGKHDIYHYR